MSNFPKRACGAAAAALAVAVTPAKADTTLYNMGYNETFNLTNDSVGETLVANVNIAAGQTFTFQTLTQTSGGTDGFIVSLYTWNNDLSAVVGAPLAQSPVMSVNSTSGITSFSGIFTQGLASGTNIAIVEQRVSGTAGLVASSFVDFDNPNPNGAMIWTSGPINQLWDVVLSPYSLNGKLTVSSPVSAVPEAPTSLLMLGGAAALGLAARRRQNSAKLDKLAA